MGSHRHQVGDYMRSVNVVSLKRQRRQRSGGYVCTVMMMLTGSSSQRPSANLAARASENNIFGSVCFHSQKRAGVLLCFHFQNENSISIIYSLVAQRAFSLYHLNCAYSGASIYSRIHTLSFYYTVIASPSSSSYIRHPSSQRKSFFHLVTKLSSSKLVALTLPFCMERISLTHIGVYNFASSKLV